MTRQQIVTAAEQIAQAVEQAGIADLMQSTGERSLQDYLKSFKQYNILAEKFGEGALFLEKTLGFFPLREPDPWIVMSKKGEVEAGHPLRNIAGVLSALRAVGQMLSGPQSGQSAGAGREILSLVVFEQPNQSPSSPRRIADALESVSALYEACARIHHREFDDLTVVACDSGSDKVFHFEGHSAVVRSLKDLILSIWERIVFYRERTVQERISLLTHSIPVLDKVAEMELHGSLDAPSADLARKAIVNGVRRFLSSGSMIQRTSTHEAIDERALIVPESGLRPAPAPPRAPSAVAAPAPVVRPPVPVETPEPEPDPLPAYSTARSLEAEPEEPDLTWDGILEDDLKTLRELIDKTKRSEEEHG
jgi:hypothetical protein